jgi:hypothetical protein
MFGKQSLHASPQFACIALPHLYITPAIPPVRKSWDKPRKFVLCKFVDPDAKIFDLASVYSRTWRAWL